MKYVMAANNLQICGKIVNSLSIEKLSDDVRGFQRADGLHVLDDGSFVIPFGVKMVAVLSMG